MLNKMPHGQVIQTIATAGLLTLHSHTTARRNATCDRWTTKFDIKFRYKSKLNIIPIIHIILR